MIVQVRRPIGAKSLAWLVNVEGREDLPMQRVMPDKRLRLAAGADKHFYCEAELVFGRWVLAYRIGGTTMTAQTERSEPLLQFFSYEHLPEHLQGHSRPFAELAELICETLPRNPERTLALRKLLEAKDCAVRAKLFK